MGSKMCSKRSFSYRDTHPEESRVRSIFEKIEEYPSSYSVPDQEIAIIRQFPILLIMSNIRFGAIVYSKYLITIENVASSAALCLRVLIADIALKYI